MNVEGEAGGAVAERRSATGFREATFAAMLALLSIAAPGWAQTDYYNTDSGRPVRVEDAFPVERYAFEAQVAPLRLERSDAGLYLWELEPELAYGILPRTHVEVGVPLTFGDGADENEGFGVGGVDVSVFHKLNVETAGLPAFAVAADVLVPVGSASPDGIYPSVKAIATRTFSFSRVHLNAGYTFGATPSVTEEVGETSRWIAGFAVDRTFPIQAALLIADVYVEQPLHAGAPLRWTVEAGIRYQLNPYFALDAGVGRRLTGENQGWFVTFGAARAFSMRWLFPVPQR